MNKANVLKILLIVLITGVSSTPTCDGNYKCVRIRECLTNNDIVLPCNDALSSEYICCSPEGVAPANVTTRTSELPEDCGAAFLGDRITSGEEAALGQFPWMALLGYKQPGIDAILFACGGSLISRSYILTAAHCLEISLHLIRLGEHDTETEIDCYGEGKLRVCSEKPLDVLVDKYIGHENYNNITLENDIALVKMQDKVTFTEFVRPICLPFNITLNHENLDNKKVTISGWGKTNSNDYKSSPRLMFADVRIWNLGRCNSSVPASVRPIKQSQVCANGVKRQDSCKGDSGGPMINYTTVGGFRNFQIGIVSFSASRICGNAELPTIYTKVDYFLDWIVRNVNQN